MAQFSLSSLLSFCVLVSSPIAIVESLAIVRIDTQTHFLPPVWREKIFENGLEHVDGTAPLPDWSEESHLSFMESLNISKSILSIPSPGTHLVRGDDASARKLTRDCNVFAADLKRRNPDKFGYWASLPLPDVEGSLTELAYAMDELNADGVNLFTNSHGIYLGNQDLKPLFAELNRRSAIVLVHAAGPFVNKDGQSYSAAPIPKYSAPAMEFFFDTARAVVDLFLSSTIASYPNITYLIGQAGGALPPLIDRFFIAASAVDPDIKQLTPEEVKVAIREQFYFDLAGFPFPDQIHGLLPFASSRQLLYGSDFPFESAELVKNLAIQMDDGLKQLFPDERERQAVYSGNAQRILR